MAPDDPRSLTNHPVRSSRARAHAHISSPSRPSALGPRWAHSSSEPVIYLRGFFPLRGDPEYEEARAATKNSEPYWFTEELVNMQGTRKHIGMRYEEETFAGESEMGTQDDDDEDEDMFQAMVAGFGEAKPSRRRRVTFEGDSSKKSKRPRLGTFDFEEDSQDMDIDWPSSILRTDVPISPPPTRGKMDNKFAKKTQKAGRYSSKSLNMTEPQEQQDDSAAETSPSQSPPENEDEAEIEEDDDDADGEGEDVDDVHMHGE